MYQNYKVVAVTPAGRKDNLRILQHYILRDRQIFDRWMIWVNTPHKNDLDYINQLKENYPEFVELVFHPEQPILRPMPQPPFFAHAIDPGQIFIKFDDDICWVEEGAVETLVNYRLDHPHPLFVMANTIVNPTCAYIHQKNGAQTFEIDGVYERIPQDYGNQVWYNPRYGEYVHRTFLNDLANNDIVKYKFDRWVIDHYHRLAINCICWTGKDFAEFGGIINHYDEEAWLCSIKTKETGRPAEICGNSLVVHHAFYRHRLPHCSGKPIDPRILMIYKLIAEREAGLKSFDNSVIKKMLFYRPMI
jgi:hypothetical protein